MQTHIYALTFKHTSNKIWMRINMVHKTTAQQNEKEMENYDETENPIIKSTQSKYTNGLICVFELAHIHIER